MSEPPVSAEEAARKAREIAARLLGTSVAAPAAPADSQSNTASTTTGTKRKRWGVAPSAGADTTATSTTMTATTLLPGMDMMAKKLQQENEPVQKRLWITNVTKERPAWHYVTHMSPKLQGIVVQCKVEHPEHKDDKLEIQFKGRGSSRQPALPGIPEEPLHVFVEGPPLLAETAEGLIEILLQEAEQAPVTIDVSQEPDPALLDPSQNDRQLAMMGGAHAAGANGSYRPATVAQMIGNPHAAGADMPVGDWPSEEIHVPNGVVGFIIGRGGETITSMQARTGAKVQIQKENELQPGQTMRIITVSAPTADQLEQCKTMITSMVDDRVRAAGGSPGGAGGFGRRTSGTVGGPGLGMQSKDAKVQQALDQGHVLKTVEVPDADVGLIIGKGGSTIQDIQGRTGASIQIPPSANADNTAIRTVSITHPTDQGAQEAATMIESILASKKSHQNSYGNNGGGMAGGGGAGAQTTIQVAIPDKDVGLCIGRQGCVIKEMQNKSRTRIQIPGQPTPGQPHRIATVSGTPEACEQVRQMIDRIVMEQSSGSVMAGTAGGPGGGYQNNNYNQGGYHQQQHPPVQQQQGGQQDYSAEWAAYYAAQQVAQQQQAPAPAPAPVAAAPAPGPEASAYHEEYFRYAYYYGEPAARAYYGAWSPPVGTPNPYGVNPDGVTAPPAGGEAGVPAPAPAPAAAAPTPAAAPAAVPQGRETSRRKVSNLPAWMTRGQQ